MSENKTPTAIADEIALWFISEYTRMAIDGPTHRALARRIADALDAERERACAAVCTPCSQGIPVSPHKGDVGFKHFVNDGLQPKGENGRWVGCAAAAIRAR